MNLYVNNPRIGFFSEDGRVFLERCPKCFKENHAMHVAEGCCAWCGFREESHFDLLRRYLQLDNHLQEIVIDSLNMLNDPELTKQDRELTLGTLLGILDAYRP